MRNQNLLLCLGRTGTTPRVPGIAVLSALRESGMAVDCGPPESRATLKDQSGTAAVALFVGRRLSAASVHQRQARVYDYARTGWRMTSSGVQGADRAFCNLIAGRVGDDLQLGGANGGIMPLDERGSRSGSSDGRGRTASHGFSQRRSGPATAPVVGHVTTHGGTMAISDFERYPLTFGPSPVHLLDRLTEHLGGARIWAKREDCNCGLAFGGNKTRKLEYIVPDVLASGADTLVSIGGYQSNHTRQVAAVGAKLGLKVRLVQERWVDWDDPVNDKVGNILLSQDLAPTPLDPSGFDIASASPGMTALAEV